MNGRVSFLASPQETGRLDSMNPLDTPRPDHTVMNPTSFGDTPRRRPFLAVFVGSFLIGVMLLTAAYLLLLTALR